MKILTIELLALDLSNCGRCVDTSAALDTALATVSPVLHALGVRVDRTTTVVSTADDAIAHRLAASPTIRMADHDLAGELLESACAECGALCDCAGDITCRAWAWRGETYAVPPVGMLVERILSVALHAESADPAVGYALPDNLTQFFAAMERNDARKSEPCCTDKSPTATCC